MRIALVIGNGAYKDSPLKNPVNDARAVAAKLKALGFEVILKENLIQKQIGATLREFRSRLAPGSEALFFYAGHGLQVNGVNYLPAVDADISAEEDVPNQSLSVSQLLELMDSQKTRLNLVFLDACRNNPFTRSFRAAGGGLAKISPPSGTILSYATRPGNVAADGTGSHGLYTEYPLQAMDEPGVPIEQALKTVLGGVKKASSGKQEPWIEGGIEGNFYFNPTQADSVPAPMVPSVINTPAGMAEAAKHEADAQDRLTKSLLQAMDEPGVPQDYAEAAKWYRKAADQGDAEAQCILGASYYFGLGVPQDYAEAAKWYRKAAEQGYALAQFNLGVSYYSGEGVPQDYAEAYAWYSVSAASGNAGASKNRDITAKNLTPQALVEAQLRARKLYEEIQARIGKR
jgi:uncharacterized caspase-like protein